MEITHCPDTYMLSLIEDLIKILELPSELIIGISSLKTTQEFKKAACHHYLPKVI